MNIRQRLYPEVAVGGYSRTDTTVEFYVRVGTLIAPHHVLLDLGAGRGSEHIDAADEPVTKMRDFRGRCARVIGADVDSAVFENPSLDEAVQLVGDTLPLDDNSVDIIICDWVAEHISDPAAFVSEIRRVLKPEGWFCARTPNRWGYIGIGTNIVPNKLHVALLKWLQPNRKEIDVFPTHYRLNTRAAFQKVFSTNDWQTTAYAVNGEPAYFGNSTFLWRLAQLMFRLLPPDKAAIWLVFAQRVKSAEVPGSANA